MKLLLALFLLLGACNYNKVKTKGAGTGAASKAQLENPDFETVNSTVLIPKCVGCHSNAGGNRGGTNLEGYAAVKALLPRVMYRALDAKTMPEPPDKLTQMQLDVLEKWWNLGAPERLVGGVVEKPIGDLEKGPTDWAKIREGIFRAKCLDCHQPPNPEAKLDLSSLEVVREHMGEIVNAVFIKNSMPKPPYRAFTPVESRVFMKWVTNGTPK